MKTLRNISNLFKGGKTMKNRYLRMLSAFLASAMVLTSVSVSCPVRAEETGSAADAAVQADVPVVWPDEDTSESKDEVKELAAGKPVTASKWTTEVKSGVTYEYKPELLNDGDPGTRWYDGDNKNNGNWVCVDLEQTYGLSELEINWASGGVYAPKFEVQVSDDGQDFRTISTVDGEDGVQKVSVKGYGRYVRLYFTEHGTWGTSINELKVYGTEKATADHIEAESAEILQGENSTDTENLVSVKELDSASGGKYVDGFEQAGNGSGIRFTNGLGEETENAYLLYLGYARYYYEKGDQISVYVNDEKVGSIDLTAESDDVNQTIRSEPFALSIAKGDVISLRVDTEGGDQGFLRMDYVELEAQSAMDPSEQIQFTYPRMQMIKGSTARLLLNKGDIEDIEFFSEDDTIVSVDGDTITAEANGKTRIMGRLISAPSVYAIAEIEVTEETEIQKYELEAEDATLVNGAVADKPLAIKDSSSASGGKFADNFYDSGDGAGVEFTVPADAEEGEFRLSVRYARDTYLHTDDYMTVWVNGEKAARLNAPPRESVNDFGYGPDAVISVKGGDVIKVGVDSTAGDYGLYRLDGIKLEDNIAVPVSSIDITDDKVSLKNKTSLALDYTVNEYANTEVSWESEDPDIATVSGGMIRGLSEGKTTVTAYSALDPEVSDTVEVEITENGDIEIIENDELEVMIDKSFPQVYQYELKSNGGVMQGNTLSLDTIKLNGQEYQPEVKYKKISDEKAQYTLTVDEMDAEITLTFAVDENDFKMDVTEIKEGKGDDNRIYTFEIPDQKMISVSSLEEGASFAGSKMETDITKTGDVYQDLTSYKPANESVEKDYLYAFLSNDKVSAGIRSNAMPDNESASGRSAEERLMKQTVKDGSGYLTSLWSGAWKYRAHDYTKTFQDVEGNYGEAGEVVTKTYQAEYTEQLPLLYISFAGDINESGNVDWQDGAVAFRDIMQTAEGMDEIPDAVVQRLVFPQSGEGNYPYLASLDETKRVYLATDGLGQMILNKYHNEGTWADLGHYDDALGGYKDFKYYVDEATEKYNSWVGVHTNFTEIFAKARAFRPEKISMEADGITPVGAGFTAYNHWLQQVYQPDIRFDALSLERQEDLVNFKNAVPNLGFVYSDVFSGGGWKARRLAEDYKAAGLAYCVEWPYQNEAEAVWSHWAVEKPYSPTNNKGYVSDIARFIFNHTKDRWDNFADDADEAGCSNRYPNSANLLMGADTTTYEGWPQKNSNNGFDSAMEVVFDNNLPTKYMQHFPILRMEKDEQGWASHIWFGDNVEVFQDAENGNKRTITKDGKVIYNQDSYLIPWDSGSIDNQEGEAKEVKLYHWNENGGDTTWELPDSWDGLSTVWLYRLTDQGKTDKTEVAVRDGKITLTGIEARTAYVVYKGEAEKEADVEYGDGGYVSDPGFNYGDLQGWTVDKGTPEVKKNDTTYDNTEIADDIGWGREVPFGEQRNYELIIDGTDETQVSQKIEGLEPGTYAASVMVEVQHDKQRKASIIVDNGERIYSNYADKSILPVYDEYDSKIGTYMLRMRVNFEVPEGQDSVTLMLNAEAGEGRVRFDNVRVFETELPVPEEGYATDKVIFYQDFELAYDEDANTDLPEGVDEQHKPTYEAYYPFNLGGARGIHETRVSIQLAHAPYTNNGTEKWDPSTVDLDDTLGGERALKVIGIDQTGIAVQTLPQTIRFTPGKTYRVTFKYQTQPTSDYEFVLGNGDTGITSEQRHDPQNLVYRETLEPTSTTAVYSCEFTVDESWDQLWFGINRKAVSVAVMDNPAPIVLDDILVEEVGSQETEQVSKKTLEYFLNSAKAHLEAGDVDNCVESVQQLFEEAIAQGEAVMADEGASGEEIFDAALQLMKAVHALGMKAADKTDLQMAVELAGMISLEDYVEAGQKEFAEALEKSNEVLADGDALQEDADAAWDALVTAMENLRLKADKDVLEALLNEGQGMDLTRYTEESAAVFRAALASAQAVFEDETLSVMDQQKVDDAVAALKEAKDGLTAKADGTGDGEGSGQDPDSGNQSDVSGDAGTDAGKDSSDGGKDQAAVQTGDGAPVLAAGFMLILSAGAIILIKRRKYTGR